MKKQTFALYFGNRGFMPAELIQSAREDMKKAVTDAGFDYLIMDEDATRYGAVETRDEGRLYARWLKSHEGEYDGVILCMPIFVDENGAAAALQDAGVPILMQAYPDEIGKMDFKYRRDAYCGKFSVTDVFSQYNIPFTVMKPHVVHPLTPAFAQNLQDFAAVCRVVNGMKRFTIGCIGGRISGNGKALYLTVGHLRGAGEHKTVRLPKFAGKMQSAQILYPDFVGQITLNDASVEVQLPPKSAVLIKIDLAKKPSP